MCGATDSQSHAFRSCTHTNVGAIREQTYTALQDLAAHFKQESRGIQGTLDGQRFTLVTGVLHELKTCTDAARAWTGNWSRGMITRMTTVLEMDNITKKECAALRRTLIDAYHIIAQGANDIMNVRHDVSEVQDEHKRRKQLLPKKPVGQLLITNWLGQRQQWGGKDTGTSGLAFTDDDDMDEQEQAWIPPLNQRTREELQQELHKASAPDTIMATQGQSQTAPKHPRWRTTGQRNNASLLQIARQGEK